MSGNMEEQILDLHVHRFGRKAEIGMVNRFSTLAVCGFEGVIQTIPIEFEESITSKLVKKTMENH